MRRTSALLGLLFTSGLLAGQDGIIGAGPFCENVGPQALSAQPAGGIWGGAADASGSFDPSLGASGSPYLITYTWTDSLGASITDSAEVLVRPLPLVVADPAGPVCENAGILQLAAQPSGGIWDGDLGSVSSSGQFNPFFGVQFSPYAAWYSVTDTNGCTASDTILVQVLGAPVVDVIEPLVLCPSDSAVQVQASPAGGTWAGDVDSLGVFDPGIGPGNYWASYTVVDSAGCSGIAPASISVLDQVQAQLQAAGPFCAGDGPVYLWATPFFGAYGGAADSLGYIQPQDLGPGQHLVTYTYACPGCCPTTDSLWIEVLSLPDPALLDLVLCADLDSVQLSADPPGGTWGGAAQSAGWVFPMQLGTGLHAVSYTYTDSLGCTGTLLDSIDVRPRPSITFQTGAPICAFGPAVNLNALPPGGTWSGGATIDGVVVPGSDTTLVLTYTYGDSISCTGSRDTLLQVHPLPVPLLVPAGPFCTGDATAQLTAFPAGGSWGGAADPSGLFDPMSAAIGQNAISYTFTDSLGCTGADSSTVLVVDATPVGFGPNGPFCTDDGVVVLSAFPEGGAWSGAATTDGSFDTDVAPGTFVVTYTYSNGVCTTEATDTVVVDDCTFVRELDRERLRAHPVPADEHLVVMLPSPAPVKAVGIIDSAGRPVTAPFRQEGGRLLMETLGLPAGSFIVQVVQDGRMHRARVQVMH